jgi:hypothetical protein
MRPIHNKKHMSKINILVIIVLVFFAIFLLITCVEWPLQMFFNPCKGDELSVNENKTCFDEKNSTILITLQNKETPVVGLIVAVEGAKNVPPAVEITQDIKIAEPAVITVPYDHAANGNIDQIIITAKLNKTNTFIDCPLKQKITQVPACLE